MLTYVHSMALRAILFVFVVLFTTNLFAQPRVNVPPLISAPIILYDEGNHRLPDGDYQVRVRLFDDLTGNTLFEEEHLAEVRHGICHLNIGLGKAIDSNGRAASGGLDYTHFLVEGDIGVEILVEGQSNPQLLTYLSSQPYSFISQMALSVPGESISSYHIKDQSISLDDLHPSVIEQLSQGGEVIERVVESNATPLRITTDEIYLPDGVVLKNSGGDTLAEVLNGIDRSLDTIREVHVKQRVSQINENIENVENNFNGGLENLNNQLQQEVNDRIVADNDLSGSLNQINNDLQGEIANRIAGDTALDGRINTVTNNLNQEINNRTNADNNLTQSLNTEIQNRTNADNNLSGRINVINNTINNLSFNDINGSLPGDRISGRVPANHLDQTVITENELNFNIINGEVDDDQLSDNIVKRDDQDFEDINAGLDGLDDRVDVLEASNPVGAPYVVAYGSLPVDPDRDRGNIEAPENSYGISRYRLEGGVVHNRGGGICWEGDGGVHIWFSEERPDTNYVVSVTPSSSIISARISSRNRDSFIISPIGQTDTGCIGVIFNSFDFVVYSR